MNRKFVFKNLYVGIIVFLFLVNGIISVYAETENRNDMSIRLQSVSFDPAKLMPTKKPANLFISSYPAGTEGDYIIQFNGPIMDEYKRQLKNFGVKFYGYIPNYAFIVRMNDAIRKEIETLPFIRWVGIYQPAYKISPSAMKAMEAGDTTIVNVLLFDVNRSIVTSKIKALGGNIITNSSHKVRVSINSSKIPQIAKINGVMWIEKYVEPKLCNNVSAQIMNVDPIVWITHGLDGTGQIVAVADTGLDTGVNDATMHDDFEGRIINIHSWPVQPNPWINNVGADDGASDRDSGHGTHVAGSALGNGSRSNGDIKGIAYNASLVFQAIEQWTDWIQPNPWHLPDGYYLTGIPADLNDLFQQAYDDGARIHSNSWGAPVNGEYNSNANETDTFIWNHKDMTILFAAGNEGNDTDRDGVVDYDSISSPGTAKNVITVGASENIRLAGGYQGTWGAGWPSKYPRNPIRDDHVSNNSNGMAAFSSRGPCDDNRIKPDVVAPGTNVLSTRSSVATGTGWGVYDQYYMYDGGTSMSTPLTAGAAALVRQYYMENRSHTPSASLIKATLINGAVDMPGQYTPDETGPTPNNNEGWGRVDLANSIFPTPPKVLLFEDNVSPLSTGQSQSFYYKVTNRTVPLKITLVWTDYPATVPAGGLVNDLDLIVTSPCGDVYHGNDFVAPFDDTFDRTNNVEQVRINSPEIGTYNVTVKAHNIPNGPQDFSLVISGAVEQTEAPTEVEKAIEKGLCWLYHNQNPDGSWSNSVGITSLATLAFLNAGYDETNPTVRKAINYILSKVQPDGRITTGYDTYETSLAIIALVATHNNSYNATIENAAQWLKDSQWDESCLWGSVSKDDWRYGGFGYGHSTRPDLSNTQFALMALDAVLSISKDDLLWDKAQVFLARTQMRQENVTIPDLNYTVVWNPTYNKYNDGGFVYYPGASLSGTGTSYGSMTAAGIWSLRLCNVPTNDPRIQAALNWLKGHYTWTQNPGMTPDGRRFQYYYYLALSKALMMTVGEGTFDGHDWYADLSANLTALQHADGHWVNTYTGHGGEDSPELCTAYSILSLQVREIPTEIKRLSWITLILRSNADLHVYDPLGRHVGKNYDTGEIEIQIPNATYTSNAVQNITLPMLETGNYRIVLIGTGTGNYTLNVTGGVGDTVVSENSYTGSITEGEVHDSIVSVAMITWLTIHVEEPEPIDPMVPSATGTGNVSFIADTGTIVNLTALNESDLPEENPNVDFPHGLFSFNITGLNPNQTVNITIAFPQNIPTTAQYWKYGPNGSIDNPQPERWYQIPMGSNDGDNIITITLQDGGIGDDDGVANGVIVDQGGPGIPTAVARVPTLTPIGITALAGLLLIIGIRRIKKRK